MMWQTLWKKIGKQPAQITDNENVVAIFTRDELIKLLNQKKPTYMIPLALKFGTGRRRMWFVSIKPKPPYHEHEHEHEHNCEERENNNESKRIKGFTGKDH